MVQTSVISGMGSQSTEKARCRWRPILTLLVVVGVVTIGSLPAMAATTCTFTTVGTTMTLDADCTTDATILVPDGMTLDGNGHTITASDPPGPGGHFLGAIIKNAGSTANVINLTVTTSNLVNVCDPSSPTDTRLRGIMFQGASGVISGNSVLNINQGPSGCQEGNAIEVRNAPFDGSHPNTQTVEVSHNLISAWQKTGIVANGDVDVTIMHNAIGPSATQANLAANSVQVGYGGKGRVEQNHIAGNSWLGPSDYVATGILLFNAASGTTVRHNNLMEGNADVGIYIFASGVTVDNNRIFETGPDLNQHSYDYGVVDEGVGNTVTNNKIRGFGTPYDPVAAIGNNKVIPSHDD